VTHRLRKLSSENGFEDLLTLDLPLSVFHGPGEGLGGVDSRMPGELDRLAGYRLLERLEGPRGSMPQSSDFKPGQGNMDDYSSLGRRESMTSAQRIQLTDTSCRTRLSDAFPINTIAIIRTCSVQNLTNNKCHKYLLIEATLYYWRPIGAASGAES
jgi:hypothetical protein